MAIPETYHPKEAEIQAISQNLANDLVNRSVREPLHPEEIQGAIATSLESDTPIRLRMVLCPNWQVTPQGRTIGEIPVSVGAEYKLEYGDPSMRVVPLLSEETPRLVAHLNKSGVKVELLVVLADILSPGWVHDPKTAKQRLDQNHKAIRMLLQSSQEGKEVFNDPNKAKISVQKQLQLATHESLGNAYKEALDRAQMEALQMDTPMNAWYLHVMRQLQSMGEYTDQRTEVSGMRKVWERGLFLSGMYAVDGEVFKGDFQRAGFAPDEEKKYGYIGLGTVATPHGDIIGEGWNLAGPLGTITPFNNAMEHSWSEQRTESVTY